MNTNLPSWLNFIYYTLLSYLAIRLIYISFKLLLKHGYLKRFKNFILMKLGSSQYNLEQTIKRENARKHRMKIIQGGRSENKP